MNCTPESVFVRSPDVPSRAIAGKGILVDLESGYYFSLNRTGQVIWELFDGDRTLGDIARELATRFDVSEEIVLADCIELAERLLTDRLVIPAGT